MRVRVGQAFSPAAPVSNRDLFAGRTEKMESLVDVVFETGQHAVIYGERGVGKTSLASIMGDVFADHETKLSIRVNCITHDTFTTVWRKILDEIELYLQMEADPQTVAPILDVIRATIGRDVIVPNDIRKVLRVLAPIKECVFFIDEFDILSDRMVARQFADLIKVLSDQLIPATLVIIGIADDVDQLLTEHGSIQRSLVLIHMPRMSREEIKEIVERGLQMLEMTIDSEALELIAHLSQGFPHYTHLVAQAAARVALEEDRHDISLGDVRGALEKVSDRIHTSITDAYAQATASSRDALYPEVLMASALTKCDERGFFSAADVREPLTAIMGRPYDIPTFARHLNALSEEERGPILQKVGEARRYRYRFADPLLQPYVIMQGVAAGTITVDILERFSEHAIATIQH